MGNERVLFEPGCFFHVYNHGNGADNVFRCDDNYHYFLRKYGEYIGLIAETYAYCLMPNHFHFLVRIKEEEELPDPQGFQSLAGLISRTFGNFLNAYAKAYNKMFSRKGSLFLDNLKRKKVKDESYLIRLLHYIHYNPVHHGFVRDMADWTFSSYHAFLLNKKTQLRKREVLAWFGGKAGFEAYHQWKPDLEFDF